ncbi:class Ib ribonucleoside-diphosphate reductase assembly flavoprotein NrdI [Arthrobacter castelli]|uniref:class Ib ribonucleoside-diphosphate reductase assembly flavoprotein NrdI n=1 Tax=Arthrobacter castelli TaxID=271431 RepID=UPI000685F2D9
MMEGDSTSTGVAAQPDSTCASLIYFSSVSGNTHRFIEKLGIEAGRIPLRTKEETLQAQRPYVLIVPTYGGVSGKGAVPKQVIKFLNREENRNLIRGVIGAGNTNFGETYCLAGDVIATKCQVPHLYRFELMGTPDDVSRVYEGLEEFWTRQLQSRK